MALRINEIRVDHLGTDNDEYFELFGDPGASLYGLTDLVIGDGPGGSGVIEAVVDLRGRGDDDDHDDDDDDDGHDGGLNFDMIDLSDYGFAGIEEVAALTEDQGRSTVIRSDMDTSITLVGVDTDALLAQSDVFILV